MTEQPTPRMIREGIAAKPRSTDELGDVGTSCMSG
jgi:hypothetical protein